jgi:hypothetical protein
MYYGVYATTSTTVSKFCAGSMYIYHLGDTAKEEAIFRTNISYKYNGGYTMEGVSVGYIYGNVNKLKFRFNSGTILYGGATSVPVSELIYS